MNNSTVKKQDNTIELTISEYHYYPNIGIDVIDNNKNFNKIYVSCDIIKNIIENEDIFYHLINLLSNKEIDTIELKFLNSKTKPLILNKLDLLRVLFNYSLNNDLSYDYLKMLLKTISNYSYQNLLKENLNYKIKIDNENFEIKVVEFFNFLELDNSLIDSFVKNNEKYYHGIPIEKFIYALVTYFDKENLLNKYIFSEDIIARLKQIKNMELIDYESINQILETKDPFIKDVRLNQDLQNLLFQDRKNYSDLFTYILSVYLKLCNIFTYDENYYIDPISDLGMIHSDIKNLQEINENNSKIVCFEFTAIFGYFLNKLNINYEIIQLDNTKNIEYGFLHDYIVFRLDNYLIKIDPIKSILGSDLTKVKTNGDLEGFTCLNKNRDTKEKFQELVSKFYQSNKVDLENVYLPQTKFENEEVYSTKINSLLQKLDLVFAKLNELNLKNVDKVSFLLGLFRLVFTSLERELNIDTCIIHDNKNIMVVITLNEISYMNNDNKYLLYDLNKLTFISKEILQQKFNNHEYEYINEKSIPGIKKFSK